MSYGNPCLYKTNKILFCFGNTPVDLIAKGCYKSPHYMDTTVEKEMKKKPTENTLSENKTSCKLGKDETCSPSSWFCHSTNIWYHRGHDTDFKRLSDGALKASLKAFQNKLSRTQSQFLVAKSKTPLAPRRSFMVMCLGCTTKAKRPSLPLTDVLLFLL